MIVDIHYVDNKEQWEIRSLIMDVNQVRFGNFSTGNSYAKQAKEEKPEENKAEEIRKESISTFNPENVLGAMDAQGLQNLAQVNMVSKKEVNPADYLTEDRIADIEAMMVKFEDGVNLTANILEEDFPMMSPDNRLALAAHIFAAE